jgi:LysR family transcriptional regulator AphB
MTNTVSDKHHELRPRFSALVNDVKMVTQLVGDDLGISLLPMSEVIHLIKSGQLQRILPSWQGPSRVLYTVWPSRKLLSARASCLKSYIQHDVNENLKNTIHYDSVF